MAVEQGSHRALDEKSVKRIVEAKIAECGPEIERMVDLAVKKNMAVNAAGGTAHALGCDDAGHSRAEAALGGAFSDIRHVVSAAYVPLESNFWSLIIVHDKESLGNIAERIIAEIARIESLPHMPLLDLRLMHVSDRARMPPEAKVVFTRK